MQKHTGDAQFEQETRLKEEPKALSRQKMKEIHT